MKWTVLVLHITNVLSVAYVFSSSLVAKVCLSLTELSP